MHIQCTHTAAAITSSVHTAAILSSAHCSTLQPSATCSQPSSAHPVHTHCSSHYIFSTHCSKSSVHTTANFQYTLQLFYPVHTAATLSGSNTIQYIQCTFEPPQGKPIPLLAYLQNSQQTLMVDCSSPCDEEDWLILAVHKMKKTG